MRHIRIMSEPPAEWITRANELLAQLRAAVDHNARNSIIDANSAVWGELKTWLLAGSHNKCWFSEAKDCFSHWDVEHFRPKKSARDADGTEHDGYWWLAFDWRNLRICGNAGNRMKGTFFPLRPGSNRAPPFGDLRLEDQQLLDPTDEHDPTLLSFNIEGRCIPGAHVTDAWEKSRVEYSVQRCNLDFGPLMDKRKLTWAECWARIQQYLEDLGRYYEDKTNTVARDRFRQALGRVRELMREDRELSAVARACILSTGDPRLAGLLQSA